VSFLIQQPRAYTEGSWRGVEFSIVASCDPAIVDDIRHVVSRK